MIIKEAAILKDGIVYTGRRHCNIIKDMINNYKVSPKNGKQGFVTNEGKFIDRKEAAEIAYSCGQINKKLKILLSEDLY